MSNNGNLAIGLITARKSQNDSHLHPSPDWLKGAAQNPAAADSHPSIPYSESIAGRLASSDAKLSVVIPLLNEEDNLYPLYKRLKAVLIECAPLHEIIFVDDGSRDSSYSKLQELWQKDPCVTVLNFRRNLGKAAALSAGFDRVDGDYVAMMDADLQDQPEEFPKLISKMDSGFDLVTGWKQRRHDPLNKTLPSRLFNGTLSRYFKIDIHDFNCGLKIMRSSVAREIQIYGDFHRFIPVLAAHQGYRVAECVIEHAPRLHGVSKYGAKRLVTGMLDFLSSILTTRFYHKPLQMFGSIGLTTTMLGLMVGLYLLGATVMGHGGHLRPLWLIMVLLVLGGIQIICTGLLAELLVSATHRTHALYDVAVALTARDKSESSEARFSHDSPSPALAIRP